MLNLGCQTVLIKSVRTFVDIMWGAMKPLENIKRTKVYRRYLIELSTGELEKRKTEKVRM